MIFSAGDPPQKGLDGLYHCKQCGLLMVQQSDLCPDCEKAVRPAKKTVAIVVFLIVLLAAAMGMMIF